MGEPLEEYVKCLFTDAFDDSRDDRPEIFSRCFSYLGNQTNPPDIIIRNGDAIEIKKIETRFKTLALNSSHPKDVLHSDDTRINRQCRECEQWTEKDLFYVIGFTDGDSLKDLWMVQGKCYAAEREIYERLSRGVSAGLNSIPDIEFEETNELGRVNRIDPLGVSYLRIRGMWGILHPGRVFDYLPQTNNQFANLVLLSEKYYTYPEGDRAYIERLANDEYSPLSISDVRIKDPNNPANLLDAKVISIRSN